MIRLVAALALLAPQVSLAQDATEQNLWFNAHNLWIAAFDGDLRDPLRVNRPGRLTQWDWFLGGVAEYAHAPLVRYDIIDPSGTESRTNIVDHVVALNVSGGVAFHERFRLDVNFPVFFSSFDANDQYQGASFGEIRVNGMVPILIPDDEDEGVGLAVVGHLDIPSGAVRKFLGNSNVSGGGTANFSYATGSFTVTAEAGVHFRPAVELDNFVGADQFIAGLGVGYMVHPTTSLNLESTMQVPFVGNPLEGQIPGLTNTPIEMTLSLRHRRPSGFHLLGGAAVGVTRGAGAARIRAFLGAGFGKITEPPPKDRDMDGILDELDSCPDDPETMNGYKDEDGCPDALADLKVRVMLDGQPIDGAQVEVSKAGEEGTVERMVSQLEPKAREGLMPGESYDAVARMGSCLAGDADITLVEGENSLDVALRPVRGAKVIYELVAPDGKPVRDAVATWRTDAPGCADREGYAIAQDGRYEHPIGAGTHTVFVDAPGFRIYRESVTIAAGDVYVIRTQMKPTKVQVEAREIRILEKVYFETASAEIKAESFDLLDEVADTIIANDVGRVQVEGHTDSQGSDSYNLDLSDRRANSVRNYLIERGVPAAQLIAKGFGESQPVASNNTSSGRAKNRRVVFTLLDQADQTIEVPGGQE